MFLSELETLWCLCTQPVARDLVSTDSRWLASLLMLHGWLAAVCCVVSSGSAPLIRPLPARRGPARLHSRLSRSDLGNYYLYWDTPGFGSKPSCSTHPPPRQACTGAFHLFRHHAPWTIITVIKTSGPLRGHRSSAGRSGNNGSCRRCFRNCTISDTKANRKSPRDSAPARFRGSGRPFQAHAGCAALRTAGDAGLIAPQ